MHNELFPSKAEAREEEQEDSVLVEKARTGDREAFGELVRRHRAKVYGYAQSFAREPFLAEDIVQDALIRAFLHLGTLADSRRFLPWLHRIVRNQAYTKLKAATLNKEQSFSALQAAYQTEAAGETDWESLDSILYRLGRERERSEREHTATPEEALMRRELLESITQMFRCLRPRERQIVESHFFDHLSPQEIAGLFRMSEANVYQILSRSRKKLVQEKIRVAVDQYVSNRREFMKKVELKKPEAFGKHVWTTAAAAMYGLTEYTERRFSLEMLMGLTGHAFRLNVIPGNVHIAGPTMFPFDEVLTEGMRNLGFETKIVRTRMLTDHGPNANQVDSFLLSAEAREKRKLPENLPEALALVHDSIDRGYPVLAWDLFIPEFGLIYGYDAEARQFQAGDNCSHNASIPYEHLGRGLIGELFVLAIDKQVEIDQKTMLTRALETILKHYREEAGDPVCSYGLAAYATWRDAFAQKGVEPNGNAYTLAVAEDARRYGYLFWREIEKTWTDTQFDGIRPLVHKAADLYGQISDEYKVLTRMFPFPAGGEPNDPQESEEAIRILGRIEALEQEAVSLLEEMQKQL
ncbi:sigma-70 family RNA polymerase sigma factor [Brevibacillus ruminantium]|uniref:RNA polymerase sigma factor n=1 Tax=Brevibacillus ruminantium TaxID=2950604 RepID=A0ABY4WJX9_9BACL|nr:sigma-70 family RNA polymerase sigma factor [Brevibacillus ruminantium]USG66458.1 sigma-70 family RNA polymerase sigma factor [Brevibacillus ruminantium]